MIGPDNWFDIKKSQACVSGCSCNPSGPARDLGGMHMISLQCSNLQSLLATAASARVTLVSNVMWSEGARSDATTI